MLSNIKAAGNFPKNSPVIDFSYTHKTVISNIGINGIGGEDGTYGIEYGERTSTGRSFNNHEGNFINTNNVDYSGDDLLVGSGVFVENYCHNLNIAEGKLNGTLKELSFMGRQVPLFKELILTKTNGLRW